MVVAEVLETAYRSQAIRYFDGAEDLFWHTSSDIVFRSIEAALALYDGKRVDAKIESVKLTFVDQGSAALDPIERQYIFTPDNIDLLFEQISERVRKLKQK